MKQYILFPACLFIIFLTQIKAQNYGLDNTDPSVFTNYRIPDTELKSLWLNTNFYLYLNKSTFSNSETDTSSGSNYSSNFNYNLHPHYTLLKESDDRYLSLDADLSGNYTHQYDESTPPDNITKRTSKNNLYSAGINLNVIFNNYVNQGNIFYSAGSRIYVTLEDSKREVDNSIIAREYQGRKVQSYIFTFGAGIGKLRNVTPVVTAVRFQERLKQVNILDKNLSENIIEDLAGQFSRQSYYSSVYNRPDKYFWNGVEKILSSNGISLKDLNMYSDTYLKESINEIRFLRNEGILAGINILLDYENYFATNSIYRLEETFFTLGEAYLKYSHQVNLNSQVNFDLYVSGGPNISKNTGEKQKYSLKSNMGYDYEITDRLVTSVRNSFILSIEKYDVQQKYLSNYFTISLRYFVEDDISASASYNWTYLDEKYPSSINYMYHRLNNYHSLNIGLTYFFERGLIVN